MWFFRLATQYYATGRFAALGGIIPVSANLLHHAVEMYLKGSLARALDLASLRMLRHDLRKVWRCTRKHFPDPGLAQFDAAIERLHPFERLRYPDSMVEEGATIRFALFRSELRPPETASTRLGPQYDLVLEEVDALVAKMFDLADMNPKFFRLEFNERVLPVLNERNEHPVFHRGDQ